LLYDYSIPAHGLISAHVLAPFTRHYPLPVLRLPRHWQILR
jgi:hypothetical protein